MILEIDLNGQIVEVDVRIGTPDQYGNWFEYDILGDDPDWTGVPWGHIELQSKIEEELDRRAEAEKNPY